MLKGSHIFDLKNLDLVEELKLILDYAPIGINLLDPSMRIVRLNRLVERMLGVKTEDVKGKYCYEVAGNGRPCKGCGVIELLFYGFSNSARYAGAGT